MQNSWKGGRLSPKLKLVAWLVLGELVYGLIG